MRVQLRSPRRTAGLVAAATVALAGVALLSPTGPPTAAADPAGSLHLPDLQTIIPTNSFSIVNTAHGREFRYTHLVYNGGAGPLQIKPFYRKTAGNYIGQQELTTHDGDDKWTVVRSARVADAFVYHAEHGHFHFPLASFGLYEVAANGLPGRAVTLSPKIGYCIANSYIYDTEIEHAGAGGPWGNCADPTSMRGISVGGADEYDYRDPGQAVPLDGVPDGTYWFRAISDPNNDFLESDESNNEMDVKVTLKDGVVTAGATREPDTTPCTAKLGGVSEGGSYAGYKRLTVTTSTGSPSRVRYLVDGGVVGTAAAPLRAPYPATWRTPSNVDGLHWVAARVTDGRGRVCTSPVVAVKVDNSSGPDRVGPLVEFTDPAQSGHHDGDDARVGGRVAIAVSAADESGVARVQFTLDGKPLGTARTKPPYSMIWNSRTTAPGKHFIGARATDRKGNLTRKAITVEVKRVPPPLPITIDRSVYDRGTGTLLTPRFSTRYRKEVLLALVSYDGPDAARAQSAKVNGANLPWRLVKRSNSQAGVSEIWAARVDGRLTNQRVRAVPSKAGYDGMLSVFTFRNAQRVGIAAAAGAPSGRPDFYVPAVQEGSWVFAAGNDWDGAVKRVPIGDQWLARQWLDTGAGDTFWVQATRRPTLAQRLVTIADRYPTDNRWNYVGAEVVAAR